MLMYTATGQPVDLPTTTTSSTTSNSSGTSTTDTGSSGASIAIRTLSPQRPWGTIALVSLGVIAVGAAALEIDAHHQIGRR